MDRTGTHWGAIAFTLAAAFAVGTTLTSPAARDIFRLAGPAIAEVETEASAKRGQKAPAASPVTAPAPEQVGALLVRASAPPVIFTGSVTTVVYLFKNTGSVAWVKGTPAEARLGFMSEDTQLFDLGMAVAWLAPTRPAVQREAVVEPGGTAQFSFFVKGTTPGRYQVQVAPVIDGVAWTEAAAALDVTVR